MIAGMNTTVHPVIHMSVVRLDTAPSPVLATVCDDLECRLLSASDLVPDFDEIEPSHVATLLRLAIEQASNS